MDGLTSITIAGQKVGLKFGLPAVRRIFEKTVRRELIAEGKYTDLGVAHILYAGYLNYCMIKDEDPWIEFSAFMEHVEWIEDNPGAAAEIVVVIRVFNESRAVKKLDAVVEEEKKKVTEILESIGKKSNPSVMETSD